MDRLPNAHLAIVDESKIVGYLLSEIHPIGRIKAAFFRSCGFTQSSWGILEESLRVHGQTADVISVIATEFGMKYILEGPLVTPSRRRPMIRAIWFVAAGEFIPRLVTAYPTSGGET